MIFVTIRDFTAWSYTTWYSGLGPPEPDFGSDGDYYVDTEKDALYGPKSGGPWDYSRPFPSWANPHERTQDPDVSDDSEHGFMFHSVWWNIVTDDWFVCMSGSPGHAIWMKVEADPPPGFPEHRHRRRHHRRHPHDGRHHGRREEPHHLISAGASAENYASCDKEYMEYSQTSPVLPVVTTLRDECRGGHDRGRHEWDWQGERSGRWTDREVGDGVRFLGNEMARGFREDERGQRLTDQELGRGFKNISERVDDNGERLLSGQRVTDGVVDGGVRFLATEIAGVGRALNNGHQSIERELFAGFRTASNERENIARWLSNRVERAEDKVETTKDVLGARIEHTKDRIETRVENTKDILNARVERAQDIIDARVENTKDVLGAAVGLVRNEVTEVRGEVREAALKNELETLRAKAELSRDISHDGEKTRALIGRFEERRLEDKIRELELRVHREHEGRWRDGRDHDRDREDHRRELRDINRNENRIVVNDTNRNSNEQSQSQLQQQLQLQFMVDELSRRTRRHEDDCDRNRNTIVVNDTNESRNRNSNEQSQFQQQLQFQLLLDEMRGRRRRDDDCDDRGRCHGGHDRFIPFQVQAQAQAQEQAQAQADRINININERGHQDNYEPENRFRSGGQN